MKTALLSFPVGALILPCAASYRKSSCYKTHSGTNGGRHSAGVARNFSCDAGGDRGALDRLIAVLRLGPLQGCRVARRYGQQFT
jgi:hypothetical protein